MIIVYFSGASENTHRFVQKISARSVRIPLDGNEQIVVDEPYILITPTYLTTKRAVPPQVVKFLNNPVNRKSIAGVIGTGNTNFNKDYCLAAGIVADKCKVPVLHMLELFGTTEDVDIVNGIVENFDNMQTR